jgi:hypothetical protein
VKRYHLAILAVGAVVLAACADHRTDLSDEAGMAIYRDCMNAMPQGPDTHAVGGALSASGAGQPVSVSAATSSNAQAQKEIDCARTAGWKK